MTEQAEQAEQAGQGEQPRQPEQGEQPRRPEQAQQTERAPETEELYERAVVAIRSAEMRVFRLLGIAGGTVAVLAVVAFIALSGVSHRRPSAPELPRQVLSGHRVTIASLHGGPALVLFWASWCPGCGREAAAVRGLAESPIGRGRMVGVDWADHLGAAKAFLALHRWSFPNLRDVHDQAGASYGIARLPEVYVLDGEGQIERTILGAQTQRQLEAALRAAAHP